MDNETSILFVVFLQSTPGKSGKNNSRSSWIFQVDSKLSINPGNDRVSKMSFLVFSLTKLTRSGGCDILELLKIFVKCI